MGGVAIPKKEQVSGTERFFRKVQLPEEPEGCWQWLGSTGDRGYGRLRWRGRIDYAHRVSWELFHGEPPPEDRFVLHCCENLACVNPGHLRTGTPLEAARQRDERRRKRALRARRGM